VSAAVGFPLGVGFGMFAFVSLGDGYFGDGVLAGLWSALIVGVVCVLTGNKTTTVYAPRVTTTFYLGSVLFALVHSPLPQVRAGGVPAILAVFFGIVFIGGLFQAMFGLIRLGTLIKFTPHPVMAGFQNAAAALLVLVQISTLLGMEHTVSFTRLGEHLGDVRPLSLLVAAITMVVTWNARRWIPRAPPILLGLGVGAGAWYALVLMGFRSALGPVIGDLPQRALEPMNLHALAAAMHIGDAGLLWSLMVFAALGLAFIASMDSLLCERILAGASGTSRDSDRQLVRLGIGNMVAALFGGITSGVNLGPSGLNRGQADALRFQCL
jgi:MFS superfamily sulfate permease-like transporter